MNIIELEDNVRAWVQRVLPGKPVGFAYTDFNRPKSSYVLLNLYTQVPLGTEGREYSPQPDRMVRVTTSSARKVHISVQVFYAGSVQFADQLTESLRQISNQEHFSQLGLGFTKTTDIKKVPVVINKKWEERAVFDIEFFARSEYFEDVETIESVELNSTTYPNP